MSTSNGIHQFKVGDVKLTMLSDGYFPCPSDVFPTVDDDRFQAALSAAGRPAGLYESTVNAFVIEVGGAVHLVDAGGAGMGDTLGKLPAQLEAAGYSADQIQSLIITHLHPDHIGGATLDGKPAFANAEMVVTATDHGFWTNADIRNGAPDEAKPFFDMAAEAVAAYGERIKLINAGDDVLPGITSVDLAGHTPGHIGLMISSGGEELLMWSDIVHMEYLQFEDPSVTIAFDIDPEAAVAMRRKVMDQVSTDGLRVAGMHLQHPGLGMVEKAGNGYRFVAG